MEQVKDSGIVPTMPKLLEEHLKVEEMNDPDHLLKRENCGKEMCAVKWTSITRPPSHLCKFASIASALMCKRFLTQRSKHICK